MESSRGIFSGDFARQKSGPCALSGLHPARITADIAMEQFLLHSLPVSVTEQSLVPVLRHESSNQMVQSKDQAPEKNCCFSNLFVD